VDESVNALYFLASVIARGVEFKVVDGQVYARDRAQPLTADERGLVVALMPLIRGLLIQQLPDHRAEHACDGFAAAAGAALCEQCAYSIADHFWRRCGDCRFFVGASNDASCRRCGVPRLEHLASASRTETSS